jgi:hypothetical protein
MDRKRLLSIAATAAVIFMAIGTAQANPGRVRSNRVRLQCVKVIVKKS